jgi:hypothetical protein
MPRNAGDTAQNTATCAARSRTPASLRRTTTAGPGTCMRVAACSGSPTAAVQATCMRAANYSKFSTTAVHA